MNALESRIESDYASDLRAAFLARIQAREIRRHQIKQLVRFSLAAAAFVALGLLAFLLKRL